jgi:AcrR family transcriptional regulator
MQRSPPKKTDKRQPDARRPSAAARTGRTTPPRAVGPDRPAVYASPAILERRRRILAEARNLIAEHGLDGLNMEELCERAGVAKRTIYNAFQSKEQMIATAIHEYFEGYVERIPFTGEPGTLTRNVERLIWIAKRNLKIRNYIRAVMAIYFSPGVDRGIHEAMHEMGVRGHTEWIEGLARRRQLQPWVNPAQMPHHVVSVEYVTINNWSQGHVPDEDFIRHLLFCYLTFMAGATRGAARREVEEYLAALAAGTLIERTLERMASSDSSRPSPRT